MLDTRTEEPGGPQPEETSDQAAPAPGRARRAGWRGLLVPGVLAVVAGIAVATLVFRPSGPPAAKPIDQLEFVNADGSRSTLADLRGQPLVLNFFASWCIPCKAEMPDIQAVYTAAGGKVRILGMDADLDEATWRSFVAQTNITYPTAYQADQSIWHALDLTLMPSTVFISADGQVVGRYVGGMTQRTLRDQIRQHLGVEV